MPRRQPSIAQFMALLVAVIALSCLAIYGASILMFARHSRAMAYADTRREAKLISGVAGAVLREHLGRLEAMAVIGSVPAHSPESIGQLFKAISRDVGYIRSMRMLDSDGLVWLTLPYEPSFLGSDLSGLPVVREAAMGKTAVWSSIYAGLDAGNRELSLAIPSGTGFLLVDLDFEGLAESLYSAIVLSDTTLALTDAGGTYILHNDREKVDRRETDKLLLRERLAAPGLDSYEYIRHDNGESSIVSAERIPEIGWFCIVQRPADFALSAFISSVALVSLLSLAAMATASGFAVFAIRRLLADVRVAGIFAESAGSFGFMPSADSLYFSETRAIHDGISAALHLLREKDAANERLGLLNRRLTQALDELSRTQTALVESEKLAILGRLSATVAHDLNTPIGAASASALTVLDLAVRLIGEAAGSQVSHGSVGEGAVLAISRAADSFNPDSSLLGSDRRKAIRLGEDVFNTADFPEAYGLASRLVDIGLHDPADFETINTALNAGGPGLKAVGNALLLAEIIVASRIVVNAIDAASSVIAALKSYVKGGLDAVPEAIDLGEEIRSLLALLGSKIRQSVNVLLETSGNPLVYARRNNLDRVWMNLLLNALEAMAYRGTLALRIRQDGAHAVVEIEDDGPGIPASALEDIWRPFFTTKTDSQGTGLGLSIVKEILESEGGSVSVESQPGRTVFLVHLPLDTGEHLNG